LWKGPERFLLLKSVRFPQQGRLTGKKNCEKRVRPEANVGGSWGKSGKVAGGLAPGQEVKTPKGDSEL